MKIVHYYVLTHNIDVQLFWVEIKFIMVFLVILYFTQVQKITHEKDKYKVRFEERETEMRKLEQRGDEERKKLEKKIDSLSTKLNYFNKDLSEERALNNSLQVFLACVYQ